MNAKDALILKAVKAIREQSDEFIKYVEKLNPCAFSDRMVERIISLSESLSELYGHEKGEN